MLKELSENNVPQNLLDAAKNLKKTDKTFTQLSDADVDGVAGGFRMKKGYAKGYEIECPICGCNVKDSTYGLCTWEDRDNEVSCFYCSECNYVWAIDAYGCAWENYLDQ